MSQAAFLRAYKYMLLCFECRAFCIRAFKPCACKKNIYNCIMCQHYWDIGAVRWFLIPTPSCQHTACFPWHYLKCDILSQFLSMLRTFLSRSFLPGKKEDIDIGYSRWIVYLYVLMCILGHLYIFLSALIKIVTTLERHWTDIYYYTYISAALFLYTLSFPPLRHFSCRHWLYLMGTTMWLHVATRRETSLHTCIWRMYQYDFIWKKIKKKTLHMHQKMNREQFHYQWLRK